MIIVQWIGAAMLIAGVLAGAAALVESLFARNASRRLVWSGALVAGLVLPIVLSLTTPLREKVIREQRTGQVQDREIPATTIVSVGWALLSTAVLIQLLLGHRAVRREISTAEPVTVFGHRVHLGEFGPAVVGFIRPRVVIPRWVSGLPPEDQRLIVAHEAEHVASGDQLLLRIGLAAVVLMP